MSSLYLDFDLSDSSVAEGGIAFLTGTEARHAVTVSRVQVGEVISIGNGNGLVLSGAVLEVAPDRVLVGIRTVTRTVRPSPALWLVQALAKGDRDEAAIQAASELGVDGVIPWSAQRSIVKWRGPRQTKGHDRWSAIVREATKQSIRAFLPEVSPIVTTPQLARLASGSRMLVFDPSATMRLSDLTFQRSSSEVHDILVVVGPEGGVAPGEIDILVANGATTVKLGATVLRTGTAGPAAIAALNVLLGRW